MAKLTREQVKRWESKLQNGFRFDIAYFVNWGGKQIVKKIELDDRKILEAKIIYRDTDVRSRRVRPALHLQVWEQSNNPGCWHSNGMGAYIDLGEVQEKRNYNELVKLSATMSKEKIMEYTKENKVALEKETVF